MVCMRLPKNTQTRPDGPKGDTGANGEPGPPSFTLDQLKAVVDKAVEDKVKPLQEAIEAANAIRAAQCVQVVLRSEWF